MNKAKDTIDAISGQGLLPLFYHDDPGVSLSVVRSLYEGGVRVIEYTNRGPAALANFKIIKAALLSEMPGLFLGIGTIKNTTEAAAYISAAADFIVCPVVDERVGKLAQEAGLLWIPGCYTPTEINTAHQLKAGIIKLFPANLLGPEYLSAIKDIFPGQLFVPTGGVEVEEENIRAWFSAGVCAVGMGSKLLSKELINRKDYPAITSATSKVIELIKYCKSTN